MSKLNNIVLTQIGRGNDPTGHGYYGASRGTRKHEGFDVISTPNENVYSPINGKVRIGNVYKTTKVGKEQMKLIEITGNTYKVKLMYVSSNLKNGDVVTPNMLIGKAQDISLYHDEGSKGMINHIHEGVWKNGLLTDPEPLLKLDY